MLPAPVHQRTRWCRAEPKTGLFVATAVFVGVAMLLQYDALFMNVAIKKMLFKMMVSEDGTPLRHYADVYTAIYGVRKWQCRSVHVGVVS